MNATTVTPEQLLASEPKFHRGIDTPMRREASRRITYTWVAGEGDKWRNADPSAPNQRTTFLAVLTIDHHKKGRQRAHYRATLWQHQLDANGMEGCMFDARNGLYICSDVNGAGRYNANKLAAFAEYALKQLRERAEDPRPAAGGQDVLSYFRPERV